MKILKYITICIALTGFTSCNDWFDVRPTSQILAEEQFDTEKGFDDQLIGVYTKLKSTELYGQNLTFGFAEVLSQNYDINSGSDFYETSLYNYQNENVKNTIQEIWLNSYNCIANLNILLEYIDKVDRSIFSENSYYQIKGQALGLRAFLHLEMLRWFSPSYSAGGANIKAIPYVTAYSTSVTPLSTAAEVIELVKKDLLEAKECFDEDRKIDENENIEAYAFKTKGRFTPYAVLATLARACQWEGNLSEAREYAMLILDEKQIQWVHFSTMTSSSEREWDRTFYYEHIFSMTMYDFKNVVPDYFGSSAPATTLLNISDIKMDQIFEISSKSYGTDYRYACNFQYEGSDQYFLKYKQNEGGTYLNKVPVIKLGEMALIIAEAYLAEGNIESAVSYINLIRENRGSYIASDELPTSLIASEVEDEIYKEYRKDHLGEGQMFMYYKRKDYVQIPGTNINAQGIYTLALPDNEIEFGNRN